jgi:hypothetical protein
VSLSSRQSLSSSRISQYFMEHESSSLCSQELSTSPHPEPDVSSPYDPQPISLRSIYSLLSLFERIKGGLWDHLAVCLCVCVCTFPHIFSFSMLSVWHQRKIVDWFFILQTTPQQCLAITWLVFSVWSALRNSRTAFSALSVPRLYNASPLEAKKSF